MGNPIVDIQLNFFRIDQNQFYLIRTSLIEQADKQAVDTDGFSHSGSARNQKMRHLCDIKINRFAGNILTERGRQLAFCLRKTLVLNEFTHINRINGFIGDFNPDSTLTCDNTITANTA